MKPVPADRNAERGGAGVKFLIIFLVLLIVANAGYNYIPVAYAGESFKQEMQTAVVNGLALPGRMNPVDVIRAKVQKAAHDNDVPNDAFIEIKQVGNVVQAHAVYSKPIPILPFGMYTYTYQFDHTATPTGYLLKESK